jgi:hypothetical protein
MRGFRSRPKLCPRSRKVKSKSKKNRRAYCTNPSKRTGDRTREALSRGGALQTRAHRVHTAHVLSGANRGSSSLQRTTMTSTQTGQYTIREHKHTQHYSYERHHGYGHDSGRRGRKSGKCVAMARSKPGRSAVLARGSRAGARRRERWQRGRRSVWRRQDGDRLGQPPPGWRRAWAPARLDAERLGGQTSGAARRRRQRGARRGH